MGTSPLGEITNLLNGMRAGNASDREQLATIVYAELRRIAGKLMQAERTCHTLQPTVLATDAYMSLLGHADRNWCNRAHFFAAAAKAMRQFLVDHSRARHALKRGGDKQGTVDPDNLAAHIQDPEMVLALDQALTRLARIDPRPAQVVELRYFGGLTEEEIAEVCRLSLKTVKRDWTVARAWLCAELRPNHARRRPD